jgi:N-acylneuraminate cytidylyltransferase
MIRYFLYLKENSQRIPGKNHRPLGDMPLYKRLLYTLEGEPVFLNTDSEQILQEVKDDPRLSHVTAYARSSAHVDMEEDPTMAASPCLLMVEEFIDQHTEEGDIVVTPHCTSPFLRKHTILEALKQITERGYDSVSSVREHHDFTMFDQGGGLSPVNYDPQIVQHTQDLKPVVIQNGAFYIFTRSSFLQTKHRIGKNHKYMPLSFPDYIEVDTFDDLGHARVVAEGLDKPTQFN